MIPDWLLFIFVLVFLGAAKLVTDRREFYVCIFAAIIVLLISGVN